MIKKILLFLLFSNNLFSQIVINEVDADTPGVDNLEFIELKSSTPNFSLNGYALVFYNGGTTGTGTLSYFAIDLDGFSTDLNGIFHLGNATVSPAPGLVIPAISIQNGPDTIGLYLGNASDFPINTVAVATNLVDAVAYSQNATASPSSLMSILGITINTNENQNLNVSTQSIQRKNDGTFEVKIPTPGVNNDGTGIPSNRISVLVTPTGNLTEGNSFSITFSTETPVTNSNLAFTFSLSNGTFDTFDYTGNLSVTIPIGSTSVIKNISLTDDILNEGDETMKITINSLPIGFSALRNNINIRIHDNDFIVKPWGSPINPTFGLCPNTKPIGYYNSLEGLSGAALKQAIQDIIANPAVVRAQNYGDIFEMLKDSDSNPANSSQVWLMYVERASSKLDQQTGSSGAAGFWNREHIYCQSRGGFTDATSSIANGIDVWLPTSANDIFAGHADGHHIRAEDSPENSLRSERNYGVDYNGPSGNTGSWHGDVARAIFYMAVRYNGLNVINGNPAQNPDGFIGDLATLLTWNNTDRSDDFEMNHNNIVYEWQRNRNPFVDYPELANYIWGSNVGQPWSSTLSKKDFGNTLNISVYPNPASDYIMISGLSNEVKVEITTLSGLKVYEGNYKNNNHLNLNLSTGMYLVKVSEDDKSVIKKLIIK